MNTLQTIREAIERIAPDVDASTLPLDIDFREEAGLDSMDFLGILNAVRDSTGVEVAEADYPAVITLQGFAEYVDQHLPTSR